MGEIKDKAVKKGVPPAVIDAATAGISSKFGLKSLTTSLPLEVSGGMGGEYLSQVWSEGKMVNPNEVLLEGVIEAPTAVGAAAIGTASEMYNKGLKALGEYRQLDPVTEMRARDLAEKVQKDGTLARATELSQAGAPETAKAVMQAAANEQLENDLQMADEVSEKIIPEVEVKTETAEGTGQGVSIPLMITRAMEQKLKDLGYDQSQINKLTPQQANDILSQETAPEPISTETVMDRQNTLDAAKVYGDIRARKPVLADDLERFGFSLPSTWKLNEETQAFEFQGVPQVETQEGETNVESPVQTAIEPVQVQEVVNAATQAVPSVAPATPVQPETAQQGQEAVAPALRTETPKVPTAKVSPAKTVKVAETKIPETKVSQKIELPKWEEVQKNKDQIKYLKSALKKVNEVVPQEIRVEPKAGWKRNDYFKTLEEQYGKMTGLEKDISQVPAKPSEPPAPDIDARRDSIRKANLRKKLYSIRDSQLTEEQQIWKENAFGEIRKISEEVAQNFKNIPNVEDYIFDDLLRRSANFLNKNKVIGDKELESKTIRPQLAAWARQAAMDAKDNSEIKSFLKSSPILEQLETSDQPAKTQIEVDEEEKIAGETRQFRAQTNATEAPATKVLKDNGYTPAREALGPDQKIVLDWMVNKLTGSATPSGVETKNLGSYEDLAKFFTDLNKKKVNAKAVSKMATEARQALSDQLQKAGYGVTADQISVALTPEGEQARTKAKARSDKLAAEALERQEKQTLADRGRNATQNQYLAEKLVDAGMRSTPQNRQRLSTEVFEPLEGGLLEDSLVEERIANIEKGQPNEPITEQPGTGQPVPRRSRSARLRKQPSIQQPPGPSPAQPPGATAPVGTDQSQSQPEAPVADRPRPSRRGSKVGEEQRKVAETVPTLKVDPRLTSQNEFSKPVRQSVQELTDVMRDLGLNAEVKLGDGGDNPIFVRRGDRQGLTIYVNPEALSRQKRLLEKKFGKPEGAKRWQQWRYMAVATHETVHNVHLKQLEKEAGQLGLTFDKHLKNEARRVGRFLNRNRRLKRYIARLYSNGESDTFRDPETQYFEFVRMLVEQETTGKVTESAVLNARDLAAAMDDSDKRWLTRLVDDIITALTNLAARVVGTSQKDSNYLITTTKLLRTLNRDLINPPKKERVFSNYFEPEEFKPKEKTAQEKATDLAKEDQLSGLDNQSKKFLEEYAEELKIKVPTFKHKYTIFDEKTRKYKEAYSYRPSWKKSEYVSAIKEKLKELGQKPKTAPIQKPSAQIPMRYSMPSEAVREDLKSRYPKGTTTLKLIQDGVRTATTRRPFAKVGDILTFENDPQRYEVTEIKSPNLKTESGRKDWENLEGWSLSYIDKNQKLKDQVYSTSSVQTIFKKESQSDILGAAPVPSDRSSWLKPDATTLDVDEDVMIEGLRMGNHAEAVLEYLKENEPKDKFLQEWGLLDPFQKNERQEGLVEEMLSRGWVRVIGDGFNIYFEGKPNKEQLDALFETAIEDGVKLIHDLTGIAGRPKSRVLYEPKGSGLIGVAAMPRRGFITTPKQDLGKSYRLPDGIEDLAFVKDMEGGSHPVGLYEDADGNRYIVKTDQSREQFENEVAAENVYRVLGYPVADSKLIEVDGKPAKIAEFIEDGLTLKEFEQQYKDRPSDIQKVYEQLADGLLIDAFLFNYDSIGVNYRDNVLVRTTEVPTADGEGLETVHTVYRVDSGGTFDTKGFEEAPRNEPFYYDSLPVLKKNYPYLNLDDSTLLAQLSDLVLNADAVLNAVPKRLETYMGNRLQYMTDQLSILDTMAPVTGANEGEVTKFFEQIRSEMDSVKISRNNEGQLINLATGKPSVMYGLRGQAIPKSEFRYRLERTPLFKAWFGDWENNPKGKATSKILDAAGEPLLMYHGTGSYLQKYSDLYQDEATELSKTKKPSSYIRRFGLNRFKGLWTTPNRAWAEGWSLANNPDNEYSEQVVYPLYIKATNPFDPRNKGHVEKLLNLLKERNHPIFSKNEEVYAFKNGFYDWRLYEGAFDPTRSEYTVPDARELRKQGVEEETIRRKIGATYNYSTLKALVDLGFDGLWAKEEAPSDARTSGTYKRYNDITRHAEGLTKEPENSGYLRDFRQALADYNNNSDWTFLAFRRDAAKSAMNSGLFSSIQDPGILRKSIKAQRLERQVTYEAETGRNKLNYQGETLYSYESPSALASYAVASPTSLNRYNIAKVKLFNQPNTFILQQRTAPSLLATGKQPFNDILGTSEVKPRRFGVKLDKVIPKSVMDLVTQRNYKPMPDKLVMSLAERYLKENGLESSAAAVLNGDERVRPGVQEALGLLVLREYRALSKTDEEAAVKAASFIDEFLQKSSDTGRALRQYQFITLLGPEGMEALYLKKERKRNEAVREKFDDFIRLVTEKLKPLSNEALDKILKEMDSVIQKATELSQKNTKRIAKKQTMTLWQQFADSLGKGLTDKVTSELQAQEKTEETEGEGKGKGEGIPEDLKKGKSINQEMRAALRKIQNVIQNAAKEQGTTLKSVSQEEEQAKTQEEIQTLNKIRSQQDTVQKMSDLLSLWPKALQAWVQIKDSIRSEIKANPKLAPIFEEYLKTALEQPFTLPQIKRLMQADEINIKEMIQEYYRSDNADRSIKDLAGLFVNRANLGTLGLKKESEVVGELGLSRDAESSEVVEVEPSIAEKLQESIAKKIEQTIQAEAARVLDNLVTKKADRRLEPNLKRFMTRLVNLSSYGLLDPTNASIWSEFARQEGLTDPATAETIYKLVQEADTKPEGYQKNVGYQKAIRVMYDKLQMNLWDYTLSWWYMSILSGLDTQLTNLFGNLSQFFFIIAPEYAIGTIKNKNSKVYLKGVLNGLARGWDDAMNIAYTGDSWTKPENLTLSESMGTPNSARIMWEKDAKTRKEKAAKYVIGMPSTAVTRLMSAVDSMFYNVSKEFYLYSGAYKKAKEENPNLGEAELSARALASVARDTNSFKSAESQASLEGFKPGSKEYRLRTYEILDQIIGQGKTESGLPRETDMNSVLAQASAKALINVYQQEPKGFLGAVVNALNILASKAPQTRFVIPFTRIVGNIWNMSIDMTGYGLARYYGFGGALDKVLRLEGTKLSVKRALTNTFKKDPLEWSDVDQVEKDMIRFRALVGLGFISVAGLLSALGTDEDGDYEKSWFRINGGGPSEPQQKQALMKIGWKPWSFKVGNTYISYLATPMAIPLAILGETLDNQQYKKSGSRALFETGHASLTKALLVPFDMVFLAGLSDFFRMLDSSQPEQAESRAKAFFARMGSALTIPNFLKDIDQKGIPWILEVLGADTKLDEKKARVTLTDGAFIANTPALRQFLGQPDQDLLGNPIKTTGRTFSFSKADPLIEVLAVKNAFPSPARKERLLGMIPMEEQEFYDFRIARGNKLNEILNKPEMIEQLRNSKSYVAQEIVKKATSAATEYAKGQLIQKMVENKDPRIEKLQNFGNWLEKQK